MRTKLRPQTPDRNVDQLETEWWNQNAETIEGAWALPLPLRLASRRHYLNRAKNFFLSSKSTRPVEVLEIGCGSGWVGRLIAEPGTVNILGIDVSESQIELARRNSLESGVELVCKYVCSSLSDWLNEKNRSEPIKADAVLIHAILHHFSWEEIHQIFREIATLPEGTRLFLYEPVYLDLVKEPQRIASTIFQFLNRLPNAWADASLLQYEQHKDQILADDLKLLCEQATANGWVLSPKETVFQEREMSDVLSKYFELHDSFLCNFHSYLVAQRAAMYTCVDAYDPFVKWIIPAARAIDTMLYKTGLIRQLDEGYVFMGYECSVKRLKTS